MTTFTWKPQTASRKSEPRVVKAAFGDGYEQRIGDGINTSSAEWSLMFSGPISDIDAIDAFLNARNGVEAFAWVDPRGNSLKVKCESWNYEPLQGLSAAKVTATFKQVFGA